MSSKKARSRSSIPGRGRLPGGAQVATGYLTIENDGAEPDRLVSAAAEIARHTGIHQMSMVDGVMKMRELTEGLPVPADGLVKLEPNSYHHVDQPQRAIERGRRVLRHSHLREGGHRRCDLRGGRDGGR